MSIIKKYLLIGTTPPPIGGDAIWMENYQKILADKNIPFDFVDTSLLGKRAENVGSKKNIFTEIKRANKIIKNTKKCLKNSTYTLAHYNINCSKTGTIRDYLVAKIIKRSKTKLILHCHCNISDQIGKSKIAFNYLTKLFRLADKIFVLNIESRDYCTANGFDNVFIVPNFIANRQICKNRKINNEVKNVLFLGHIKRTKGIVEYLSCASNFREINFYVAGKETDDFQLSKQIAEQKLSNVLYLGNLEHDDVIEMLDKADVFLFPSYTEGFSLSLLEAMARGTPTIATDVGANREMLSNNCGYIIEARDSAALIEKLSDYISNKNIRMTHSSNSIKRVKEFYSSDTVIDLIMKLYD